MATPSDEVCRPFLPTKDLARSCAFYEALGFKKVFEGDVAIFAVGATSFILQLLLRRDLGQEHHDAGLGR